MRSALCVRLVFAPTKTTLKNTNRVKRENILMPIYNESQKNAIIAKMLAPNHPSISQLTTETGISKSCLYRWRRDAINRGKSAPLKSHKPNQWSPQNKLASVIETAPLNEAELSEYCRKKGLYPSQVQEWKASALSGYQNTLPQNKAKKSIQNPEDKKKIATLERELRRKDKALAETAALLVLSKKYEAIWGANEEE